MAFAIACSVFLSIEYSILTCDPNTSFTPSLSAIIALASVAASSKDSLISALSCMNSISTLDSTVSGLLFSLADLTPAFAAAWAGSIFCACWTTGLIFVAAVAACAGSGFVD